MHCPNCGNGLAQKGKFCPYCGSAIPEDLFVTVEAKVESKQEILDHARVEEAKASPVIKKEQEKTKRRKGCLTVIIVFIVAFVVLTISVNYFDQQRRNTPYRSLFEEEKKQHAAEIVRLEAIEDEILEDIRNGDYTKALVKAQTLYYTVDYSNDTKQAWDQKREALVEQLVKLCDEKE